MVLIKKSNIPLDRFQATGNELRFAIDSLENDVVSKGGPFTHQSEKVGLD